jgi:DNA-binding Lrp family transcriptional regulator
MMKKPRDYLEDLSTKEPGIRTGLHHETTENLSDRDSEIVQLIEHEGLTGFSFDGLRRLTGAHPETLSRILERLEEAGIVSKSPEGYVLNEKVKDRMALPAAYSGYTRIPLLNTLLPYDISTSAVIEALRGRWFERLRWVGVSEGEDGATLKWLTEDGGAQIDASFSRGQLKIDARVKDGTDVSTAVKAAHQLISRISRLYSGPRPRGRLMFTVAPDVPVRPVAM